MNLILFPLLLVKISKKTTFVPNLFLYRSWNASKNSDSDSLSSLPSNFDFLSILFPEKFSENVIIF